MRSKTTRAVKSGFGGLVVTLLAGGAVAVAGCGGDEGPAERAGEQIDETMEQMGEQVRELTEEEGMAERVGEEMDEAAEKAEEEMEEAAEEVEERM